MVVFWGVEEFLSRINGVLSTEVGYANGRTENPTYEDICTKKILTLLKSVL